MLRRVGINGCRKTGTTPTPFTCPLCKASVGRSLMNSPSTTGTRGNVPKNPPRQAATLATCKVVVFAPRKQARVSSAVAHL